MSVSGSANSYAYDYDYDDDYDYYDYDDFGLGACGKAGGSGGGHNIMTKKRITKQSGSDQGSGTVYSSKHVRLMEARRNNNSKTPTTKNQKVGGRK